MDMDTPKPTFPLRQVGHCQRFNDHYAWSLLPRLYCCCPCYSTYLYLSYASLIILHLFFSPSSLLSAAYLLLLYQSPRVSTTVSDAILICRPCHVECMLLLYLSTLLYHAFSSAVIYIIPHLCLHHPCSCLHCPASIMLLSSSLHVSTASIYTIRHIHFWFNHQLTSTFLSSSILLITVCLRLFHLHHIVYLLMLYL